MDSIKIFFDLLTTGNTGSFASFTDYDYNRFMDDVVVGGVLNDKLTPEQARNLAKFFNMVPLSSLLFCWRSVASGNTYNTVAIHPYIATRLVEAITKEMPIKKSA